MYSTKGLNASTTDFTLRKIAISFTSGTVGKERRMKSGNTG